MYIPEFSVGQNGVPILRQDQIEDIAEGFISDFQPKAAIEPMPIDIEEFTECYLGMTPDYQYLSHNGIYLGMTVFNDTDKIPVYDPINKRAEYISASAHTVIIDRMLIEDEKQVHRYRFTLGHEAGHDIFHPRYFKIDFSPLSLIGIRIDKNPMVLCRTDTVTACRKMSENWGDHEWLEWQANKFSSCLLMPRHSVEKIVKAVGVYEAPTIMSQVFNVSEDAARYRIHELRFISE